MPEARDRLSTQGDVWAINQRRIPRNIVRGDSVFFILKVEPEEQAFVATYRWRDTPMTSTAASLRGSSRTPIFRRTQNFNRPPVVGRENLSPVIEGSRGRGSVRRSSVLPAWYPRKPLQDITTIARAMERRRVPLGESEGLQPETPIPRDRTVHNNSVSASDVKLEHGISMITPHPTIPVKRCPPSIGKIPRILLNIANQKDRDLECLTPQKRLLNNIDVVGKAVMEELQKAKRTPLAKRAEGEKKMKTLMSMR